MKKKVKKLVIYSNEVGEHPMYGCPECQKEVSVFDNFCRNCGVQFEEVRNEKI